MFIKSLNEGFEKRYNDVNENLEQNEMFDFQSEMYKAISNMLSRWQGKPVSKYDVDKAVEWFLNHYEEDDAIILDECLNKLNEEEMSDEDKHDSELIRSMINKMQQRSNAAFTPEEKGVMAKYGIERNNYRKKLSVDGRDLNRDLDDRTHHYYYSKSYSNGNKNKINYADRARKLRQRKGTQIFDGPYTADNDYINSHGSSITNFDNLQDAERYADSIPVRNKIDDMKSALRDRKYYQKQMDNADDERQKSVDKAKAAYNKAIADADRWYKYNTVDAKNSRDYHQKKIDKLLKKDLDEVFIPTPWKDKAYEIISQLSNDGKVKMLMAFTKCMSDDEVGEFLHQEGYIDYED